MDKSTNTINKTDYIITQYTKTSFLLKDKHSESKDIKNFNVQILRNDEDDWLTHYLLDNQMIEEMDYEIWVEFGCDDEYYKDLITFKKSIKKHFRNSSTSLLINFYTDSRFPNELYEHKELYKVVKKINKKSMHLDLNIFDYTTECFVVVNPIFESIKCRPIKDIDIIVLDNYNLNLIEELEVHGIYKDYDFCEYLNLNDRSGIDCGKNFDEKIKSIVDSGCPKFQVNYISKLGADYCRYYKCNLESIINNKY